MMNMKNRESAINELKHALEERFGKSIRLYLFGSSARDEHSELSDIDVLVLIHEKVTNALEEEIFTIAYQLELKYNVVFGIMAFSSEFWDSKKASAMPIYENIAQEGVRL